MAFPFAVPRSSPQIAVVIATRNREAELANRALRSVMAQTRTPDFLVVIDDSDRRHHDANRRIVDGVTAPPGRMMRVRYLRNDRTRGASGAWNAGLDWLHRQVDDCGRLMIAVLDDDDSWEPGYLAACEACAAEGELDMVAADIVRHEGPADPGTVQAAPYKLCVRDFLVSNPGIQGSNIFAWLSTLLAGGLFDEALTSTTDRDLCIRLADLGFVRYGRLARPLVHHFADGDRPRLSTPGSSPKLDGLDGFYRKYHRRMTEDERTAFVERADRLFGWRPRPPVPRAVRRIGGLSRPAPSPLSLIVGMTTQSATGPALAALLADLSALRDDPRLGPFDIVLLENGPRADDCGNDLVEVTRRLRESGIGAVLINLERQQVDAAAGLFGQAFDRGVERASIALARTMLQTYVYLWSRRRPGAVAWIIDDDMRLDNLVWRGGERVEQACVDVIGAVARLRTTGVAIAIGTCTEAPPLPFASCVRTQLVDAWHNFELLAAIRPDDPFPELLAENMSTRAQFSDYYYDLSRRETDHLETPFWYVPETAGRRAFEVMQEIARRLPRILAGEEVFRPLVQDGSIEPLDHLQPSVHRGGNAFVLDLEALWDFPNGVPSIAGGDTRRSDMVWSLLNRYGARREVVKLPLPVRQHRGHVEVQKLDLDKLVRDIHGYAIYSALDDLLLERCERSGAAGNGHLPDELDLTEEEVAFAAARFRKYTTERLYAFQLSFHRAAGLAQALGRYVDVKQSWWWLRDVRCAPAVDDLLAAIELFRTEYQLERLATFRGRVLEVDEKVVREWLDTLRDEIRARRTVGRRVDDVTAWLAEERANNAVAQVRQAFGLGALRLLGTGSEGVVLTDGKSVYKFFDTGRMQPAKVQFLRQRVGQQRGLRTLYDIKEVRVVGRTPVLVYDYEEATRYQGGHGDRLRLLLDECRETGIVLTNVHPKNFVVTSFGDVKFVDYGCDTEPFTEKGWLLMARRVWLSARHASRPDLKMLMRRSLDTGELPELQGIEAFLRVDPRSTKESLLDARLESMILKRHPRNLFDYGCGKGALAVAVARQGIPVTGYDPDPTMSARWAQHGSEVRFYESTGLDSVLASNESFHLVACSLVLCVIEDDADAQRVFRDLARLTASDGHLLVAVCNPAHVGRSTHLQRREPPDNAEATCVTWKTLRATGVRRHDVHRPLRMLLAAFSEYGFRLIESEETESFDPDNLEPSSDFLILHFERTSAGRPA